MIKYYIFVVLPLRHNLQPVSIRVFNEINSNIRILKANASHLFMKFVGLVEISSTESQMELTVYQIVISVKVPEPGKLQLKICSVISKIHNDKGAIFCLCAAFFFQTKGFFVECQRTV